MEESFDLADKIAIPKSFQINSVYYLSDIFNLKVFLTLRRIHRKTASVHWSFSEEFSVLMKTEPEDVWIQSRNAFD